MASVSQTCSCGANFGYQGFNAKAAWREWLSIHECTAPELPQRDTGVFAQVERSEDFHFPEMHIGFRAE